MPLQITDSNSQKNGGEKMQRTKCEVNSRVCGYIRPVAQWNEGKEAEFKDRKTFKVSA